MVTTTSPMAIPLRFPFFIALNLAALHHTRRHHHKQRGKTMEMEKTKREKESQPVFGEEPRGSTMMCPNFPSLLFLSLSLSPLCSWVHGKRVGGGAGRGEGSRFRKGVGYCSTHCSVACPPSRLRKLYIFYPNSKRDM